MKKEIIIAGAGEAGTYLAKLLYDNKENITIIEPDELRLKYIDEHFDFMTIKGSSLSVENLKSARVEDCDLFIAMADTEEANILSAIIAKRLGAKKTIARISNSEYINLEAEIFENLGVDQLIYPEILASEEILDILEQSGTKQIIQFLDGKLIVPVLAIQEDSPWNGVTLSEIQTTEITDFTIIAIKRDGKSFIPQGKTVLKSQDLLFVMTSKDNLEYITERTGNPSFDIKNVMIMGASRVGYKTAMMMENKYNVKLFERETDKCHAITDLLKNTLIINGDGRDKQLLIEEGIEKTDAFIAVTGNSETNILACLHAKTLGVKKTIAEIENMDDLPLAQKIGVNSIINKKLIAAGHIHTHVLSKHLSSVQCLSDIEAEILEFTVPEKAKVTKHELHKLKFPKNSIIGGIFRDNKTLIIPKGNTQIQAGDKVFICAMPDTIAKASKFFKA